MVGYSHYAEGPDLCPRCGARGECPDYAVERHLCPDCMVAVDAAWWGPSGWTPEKERIWRLVQAEGCHLGRPVEAEDAENIGRILDGWIPTGSQFYWGIAAEVLRRDAPAAFAAVPPHPAWVERWAEMGLVPPSLRDVTARSRRGA